MAKCDVWACFAGLWASEDAESRLRNQLEVHQARMRMVSSEISNLEAAKLAAARAGKMDVARQAIQARRRKEAQLLKYQHLRDFCESALVRVADVATVGETLEALGAVRRTLGDAKLEDLYEKFSGAVQEISAGGETMLDIQSLVVSKTPAEDDADLLAELNALEAEVLVGAPAAQLPASSSPGAEAAAPAPLPPPVRAPPSVLQQKQPASGPVRTPYIAS